MVAGSAEGQRPTGRTHRTTSATASTIRSSMTRNTPVLLMNGKTTIQVEDQRTKILIRGQLKVVPIIEWITVANKLLVELMINSSVSLLRTIPFLRSKMNQSKFRVS